MKSNLLPLDGKVSSTIAFAIRPRFLFMSVPWPAMLYLAEAFHLDSQTHLVAYLRQKCQDGVGMMLHGLGKMISLANHGVFRRPLVYIYVYINKFTYLNIYKYIYISIVPPCMNWYSTTHTDTGSSGYHPTGMENVGTTLEEWQQSCWFTHILLKHSY